MHRGYRFWLQLSEQHNTISERHALSVPFCRPWLYTFMSMNLPGCISAVSCIRGSHVSCVFLAHGMQVHACSCILSMYSLCDKEQLCQVSSTFVAGEP